MGIFDILKKEIERNSIKLEKRKNINKEDLKEPIHENKIKIEDSQGNEILRHKKYCELVSRIYKDEDHGISMMKQATLSENIFILGYLENIVIPDLKKQGKENDLLWFQSSIMIFRKIFYDKISSMDKVWKIVSKATGFSFIDMGCVHILVCEDNKDTVIENLKEVYYDVEVVELNNEQFKDEFNELYRLGYKGIGFSDGIHRPYYISKESLMNIDNIPLKQYFVNPYTQYSMISFFQEVKRNVNYEGAEKIRQNLENSMIDSIIKTRFLIPIKKSNVNQAELPIYISSENKEEGTIIAGLYVFTDKTEMDELKNKNISLNDGWDISIYTFPQLIGLLDEAHICEICINCGSINFKLNEKSLEVLKNQYIISKEQIEKKQEEWETVEFPRMLKDKNIPMIKDINGVPIFSRKENSVLMSKFVFDILSERGMKNEIMEVFFNDSLIDTVYLYDFDCRHIALKIKNKDVKNGLFIIPMRYDDENDNNSVSDKAIHYTEEAKKIILENGKNENVNIGERTMHFYTIENKDTNKTYIPLFSDESEIEKIYSREKFRYCMVSYKDVIDNAKAYDGIVINPATMSFIIEKDLLDNIFDIENK